MKALLSAMVVALVLAATASAASPPKQMLGTWTRTVTATDIRRADATKLHAGKSWTLVIGSHRSSAAQGKTAMRGNVVPTSATQVNIELGQQRPNLYDWRRVGSKLILHARFEPNSDRAAVLDGTWVKRVD